MIKHNSLIDEVTYTEVLPNGLTVAISPKEKYLKKLVTLQVNFGGLDIHYTVGDIEKQIPEGVAHFLEHSLFSNNGRNLAEQFAQFGARVNAYTSKSVTAYTFECQNDFDYLLDYFMSSFLKPDFSWESIEKEKKIIKHELMMSEDSIHMKIYQKLKRMMYSDKAIRCDVGGTVKDVLSIDRDLLVDVFNTFYHPKNMSLIITGNVDPEKLIETMKNHEYNQYAWPEFKPVKRIKDFNQRKQHYSKKSFSEIEDNIISIGIKIPDELFEAYSHEYIHIGIGAVIGNTFGLGSKNYDYLEKNKLMNISFSAKSTVERDYGFINIYIQNKNPKKYVKEMMKIITNMSDFPLDEELFQIDKKAVLGNYIRLFDSLPRTHEYITNCINEDVKIDTYLDNILSLKTSDLEPIKNIFVKENIFTIQYLKK